MRMPSPAPGIRVMRRKSTGEIVYVCVECGLVTADPEEVAYGHDCEAPASKAEEEVAAQIADDEAAYDWWTNRE